MFSSIKKKEGFTLIELLIVVAIMGILVAIAMFNGGSSIDDSKRARIKSDMEIIATAEQKYYADMGVWPGSNNAAGGTNTYDANAQACKKLQATATGPDGMSKGPWLTKCPIAPFKGNYTVTEGTTNFNVTFNSSEAAIPSMNLKDMK